jgi:hypothetical protein
MGAAWRVRNAVKSIRMERVRRLKTRCQGSSRTLGGYSPIVILSAAPRECVAYTWYRNLLAGMIVAPDS